MSYAERKRAWARNYKRRESAWRYTAERSHAKRCPWRVGANPCNGLLEISVDRNGRTITRCEWCERREAGICRDCPRPVDSNHLLSLRCAECKYRAKLAARRRHYWRNIEAMRVYHAARQRNRRARHPGEAAAYQREYRRKRKLRAMKAGVAA